MEIDMRAFWASVVLGKWFWAVYCLALLISGIMAGAVSVYGDVPAGSAVMIVDVVLNFTVAFGAVYWMMCDVRARAEHRSKLYYAASFFLAVIMFPVYMFQTRSYVVALKAMFGVLAILVVLAAIGLLWDMFVIWPYLEGFAPDVLALIE